MPTPDCGPSDRPSIRRPALMRTGGAAWAGRGACAQAGVATTSVANRARRGRLVISLWCEANLLVTGSLSSLRLGDSPTEAPVAVRVPCKCGTSYELKEEFAGRLVKCPQCGRETRVPGVVPAAAVKPQADPVFDRDVFLLRQQLLRISEKYDVADEQGKKIVFVERPAHLLRSRGGLLAALAAAAVVGVGLGILSDMAKGTAFEGVLAALAVIGALVALIAVGVGLSAKRHVTFYRDQTKRDKLLDVLQDRKWQPITATYTVRDRSGRTMALLSKNYLYNIVRKRWYVKAPDGTTLYVAKEDSIILSLLRRFLGPLFGLVGSSAGQLPGVVRGRDGLRARVRLRTDGHRVLHERPCGLAPLRRPVARAVGRCIGRDLRGGGGSGGGLVPPPRALLLAGQTDRLRAAGVGGVSDLNGPAESLHRQLRTPRRPRRRREHRLAAGAEPAVETVQALD